MKTQLRVMAVGGMIGMAVGGCGRELTTDTGDNPGLPLGRQLTFNDDVIEANPIYSPNGRRILFESEAAGNRDIWCMPAAGGPPAQVTTDTFFDSAPSWAPDGRRITFESTRDGRKHIWILDLDLPGALPRALTEGAWDDGSPTWSPDGTRIVYESNRARRRGTDLWVSPVAGGEASRLTWSEDGVYHRSADWSPDGSALVFESDRVGGQPALFIMDLAGGEIRRLTPIGGYEGHPAWSPDGMRISFESTSTGRMEIYTIEAGGGDMSRLTVSGGFWPGWAPDGLAIVYTAMGSAAPNLWTVPVPGVVH